MWALLMASSGLPATPPRRARRRVPESSIDLCRVVVVGSSVALGRVATNDEGWAFHLGQALGDSYGLNLVNVAESGRDTNTTIEMLEDALVEYTPRLVVIGLSLANEGLPWLASKGLSPTVENSQSIGQSYRAGLLTLAHLAEQANATVVIAGVYPHDRYAVNESAVLFETDAILKTSVRLQPLCHSLPS